MSLFSNVNIQMNLKNTFLSIFGITFFYSQKPTSGMM